MATLTIRNLDDAVVARLKQRAKAHNRSLEAEIRTLLSDIAGRPTPEEFRKIADRIAAMTPKGVKQTDSVKLIREDCNR